MFSPLNFKHPKINKYNVEMINAHNFLDETILMTKLSKGTLIINVALVYNSSVGSINS